MSARPSAWIDFHGIPVELAYPPFEGDAFSRLFAAFPAGAPAPEGLRVELAASSTPCPAPGREWEPSFFYGVAQGFSCGRDYLLYDGRSSILVDTGGRSMRGTLCLPDPHSTASGMQHVALSLLLRGLGVFELHAAGASDERRTFLIVGDAGAGKTTVTLSLMRAGCAFLGDDRLFVRESAGSLEVLGYPREFHVTPSTLQAFALDAGRPTATDGKHRVNPFELRPAGFHPRACGNLVVLLPRIVAEPVSTIHAVSRAEVFGRLLGSSASVALTGLGGNQQQLTLLKRIADSAEALELCLGADALGDPTAPAELVLTTQ